MVYIQGGSFDMGSNDGNDIEKPVHRVTVSSFYMGKYQVTQGQWRSLMGNNPSYFQNCDDCPVENISWYHVQDFIDMLNKKTGKTYRLPKEAEWEYASRGGNSSRGYTYSGSNELHHIAWFDDNSRNKTHPVGQKQANELGLYDMSGNVWEWCQDWYGSDYYANSPTENPPGPATGSFRVSRGGGFDNPAQFCRVACRGASSPEVRDGRLGFRLVLIP